MTDPGTVHPWRITLPLAFVACTIAAADTHAADEAAGSDAGTAIAATQPPAGNGRIVRANLAVLGFIAAWGATNWDYGNNGWQTTGEGWFGADTDEGGADKAGHLYTAYVLGRSLTGWFGRDGYDQRKAAWAGAASSLAAMTFMELGDGFSPYGFSAEDEVMNVAGAGLAWLLATHPALDRKLALRGEYRLHAEHLEDFLTDYDRWRYYAVLKLDGFGQVPPALRWVELHAGYYTRGYGSDIAGDERREGFVGIGLSLTRVARALGWRKTAVFLDYFQPPGTVAPSP